jgi:hypothetical protein
MKHRNAVVAALLAAGVGGFGCFPVQASPQNAVVVSGQVISHIEIRRGTADYERARQWVAESVVRSGKRVGSAANLDPSALGDVLYVDIVHHTKPQNSLSAADSPPLPAPPWVPGFSGYSIGDTAIVSTTSGGWTQTWSLELVQSTSGGLMWATTEYHATRVTGYPPKPGY